MSVVVELGGVDGTFNWTFLVVTKDGDGSAAMWCIKASEGLGSFFGDYLHFYAPRQDKVH